MNNIIVEEIDLNNRHAQRATNEQDLIDLGEQFKEIMGQKDNEIKRYKNQIRLQQDCIFKVYGIISFVDYMLKGCELPELLSPVEHAMDYIKEIFNIYLDI